MKFRFTAIATAAVLLVGVSPAQAHCQVGLVPGSKLYFDGGGSCSLGFFATNGAGDRLAVTAGHCSDDVDQEVTTADGDPVGRVVYRAGDDMERELYGVTVIELDSSAYIADAYFRQSDDPVVGDVVEKFGARTDATSGKVVSVRINAEYPSKSQMESTLVGLPGDSGSAWVRGGSRGPILLGLNVGHTNRADGGYGLAIGFPINSLVALVRKTSPLWGPGFTPTGA